MQYKASNGVEIRDDGGVLKWRTTTYPIWEPVGSGVPDMADPGFARSSLIGEALAEFFQHERDGELGRWRDPRHPEYVVYPSPLGDHSMCLIISERNGDQWPVRRTDDMTGGDTWADIASAYFDAHPEPKPWHEAEDGDIWAFYFGSGSVEVPYSWSAVQSSWMSRDGMAMHVDDRKRITAGRRIWRYRDEICDS